MEIVIAVKAGLDGATARMVAGLLNVTCTGFPDPILPV